MIPCCFQPNYCYIHFSYVIAWWKIIFQKSKRPQTHLLMSLKSIGILADYKWNINKNQCLVWLVMIPWCFQPNYCYIHFLYVIAWWTFIFQKSKTPQTHLIMSFNSIGIMCGYIWNTNKNQCLEWLVMISWCFQPNYCYIHFPYVIGWWKIIFQKSKTPQTHLLMSFNSIGIMGGYIWNMT